MNQELIQEIIQYLDDKTTTPKSLEEIMDEFNDNEISKATLRDLLEEQIQQGYIVQTTKKKKYTTPGHEGLLRGIALVNNPRFAFVKTDVLKNDVFVNSDNLQNAMNEDIVLIKLTKEEKDGYKAEGKVVQVVKRNTEEVIGRYEKQKDFGFVIPFSKKITSDIFIDKKYENNAKNGDMVQCVIYKYPVDGKKAEGRIINIIAKENDKDMFLKAIISSNKLSEEFPEKVLKAADKLPDTVLEKEKENRTDLTEEFIFTIDGWDAKDLDDAISIKKNSKGNYVLGVHIADVSHYVRENTVIDSEAIKRGTSVYLVNTVLPMLPVKLSNGICSLLPNLERLTLSCIMEITPKGKVIDHNITKSVIISKARLVYDEVSDFLEGNSEKVLEKAPILREKLKLAEELSLILRKARFDRGAMDFDFPESSIEMDEKGDVVLVEREVRRVANKIIEEFMLVANETVATQFYYEQIPFVYRVHEYPDEEKLDKLSALLEIFNYHLRIRNEIHPKELQTLLNQVKGKKEELVISTLMLRSLKKARYSNLALGHFSLCSKFYCHFTSPIRRYPDLQIHRIISETLEGKMDKKRARYYEGIVAQISDSSSKCEVKADEAERQVDDLRKTQYMSKFIGEEFEGIISSITNFGMFVQLDNTIEGLIRLADIEGDFYVFDETNYQLVGNNAGKKYTIGQKVKVKVANTSEERREVDFLLVE